MPKTAAELEALYGDDEFEDETDDPPPEDPEEFRRELARRINRYIAHIKRCWRACANRDCRRARECRTRETRCINTPLRPPRTPEQTVEVIKAVQRALDMRRQQIIAERRERREREAAREQVAQSKLAMNRTATSSRKQPKAISSARRGSQCASRTP